MNRSLIKAFVLSASLTLIACTGGGPAITTQTRPNINFSQYKTYSFADKLGTDKPEYTTIITSEFKTAVQQEMFKRGYVYTASNPDLWVNFFSNVENRSDTYSTPGFAGGYYGMGFGGYGYGYGLGFGAPFYGRDVETINYKVGTVSIDVVDFKSKELIWTGMLEGALTKKSMENPGAAIQSAVTQIFSKYPVQGNAIAPVPVQ
ncbi:MAG: DUF4136 domain-containing protein [Arenimonas sp.]|nr:DUF4136 domain-containing protein [Arenimonas sp.]